MRNPRIFWKIIFMVGFHIFIYLRLEYLILRENSSFSSSRLRWEASIKVRCFDGFHGRRRIPEGIYMLCITKLGATIVIGYLVVECFVGDTSEASSRFGGFLKWGATTKYPKLDHFSIESHGDLGIPLFKKPPYDHEGWWIVTLNQVPRVLVPLGNLIPIDWTRDSIGDQESPLLGPAEKSVALWLPILEHTLTYSSRQDLQTFSEESIGSCRLPAQNRWFLFGPGFKPATNSKSPVSHWFNSW